MEITSDFSCHHNEQLNGIRSIRKFLRASNNATTEINNGVYINLIARYFWYQENSNICCHIEIGWEPWYINNGVTNKWTNQGTNNFSQSNCSVLKINGNIITDSSPIAAPIGNGSNMIYYDNGNIKPVEITNNYQSLYCFHITTVSTDKNINIEYKYEYESSGTIYSVDFTDNNSLKIYRPSKYDDNFVFNRKGLNELIKNIKEYPLIGATSTTMDSGAPGILFTHGNGNAIKIPVGNNISFNGANSISIDDAPIQNFGTFRVSINGNSNTYEVPIKGFSASTGQIIIGNNNTPITITGSTSSSINLGNITISSSSSTADNYLQIGNTIYGDGTHQKKIKKYYVQANGFLSRTSNTATQWYTGYSYTPNANYNTFEFSGGTGITLGNDVQDIIVAPAAANDYAGDSTTNSSWDYCRDYGVRCLSHTTNSITFKSDEKFADGTSGWVAMSVIVIYK